MRHLKGGCLRTNAHSKQIWIAEAMLQLCYHNGAGMAAQKSMSGSENTSIALQRIAEMQRTAAAQNT